MHFEHGLVIKINRLSKYDDESNSFFFPLQILEKLYDPDDIVIAYELVKLSSVLLSLGDDSAVDSISRIGAIFSRYYGLHADLVFPYLQFLRREI